METRIKLPPGKYTREELRSAIAHAISLETGRLVSSDEITIGDVAGVLKRGDVLGSVAGCRLGCGCKQHNPVKPAPFIPTIDDFDLLPDA